MHYFILTLLGITCVFGLVILIGMFGGGALRVQHGPSPRPLQPAMPGTTTLLALAVTLIIVIVTCVLLSEFDRVKVLSMEGALLLIGNRRWNVPLIEITALIIFSSACIALCFFTDSAFAFTPIREYTPLINERAETFAVVAASLLIGSAFVSPQRTAGMLPVSSALHYGWTIALFLLASAETYDIFRWATIDMPGDVVLQLAYLKYPAFAVVWALYSLPLVMIGLKRDLAAVVIVGLVCALIALILGCLAGFTYEPVEHFTVLFNVRMITLVIVAVSLYIHSQLLHRFSGAFDWLRPTLVVARIGVVLCGFILVTGETRDYFQKAMMMLTQSGSTEAAAGTIGQFLVREKIAISGMWFLYSVMLMWWGISGKYREMQFAAGILFDACVLKVFLFDLSFLSPIFRIAAFLGLGILVAALPFVVHSIRTSIRGRPAR
jgi:uncharacterized membrane protein